MEEKEYYHYDRLGLISRNLRQGGVFKNNEGKLNGFFITQFWFREDLSLYGSELFGKIEDYVQSETVKLDFLNDLIARFESNTVKGKMRKMIIELIFENIRRRSYRHLPSRLTCIFLCKSIESLKEWVPLMNKNIEGQGGFYKFKTDCKIQ